MSTADDATFSVLDLEQLVRTVLPELPQRDVKHCLAMADCRHAGRLAKDDFERSLKECRAVAEAVAKGQAAAFLQKLHSFLSGRRHQLPPLFRDLGVSTGVGRLEPGSVLTLFNVVRPLSLTPLSRSPLPVDSLSNLLCVVTHTITTV
jgi:hypothetical protein